MPRPLYWSRQRIPLVRVSLYRLIFMKNSILFWLQAALLLAIAVAHAYALSVDLYWHYPLANRIIHFSGGLWVALASVWLLAHQGLPHRFIRIMAVVIGVSIAWEIFEYAIGMTKQEANYVLDTSLDLLMDVVGGALGYFVAQFMVELTPNEGDETDPS